MGDASIGRTVLDALRDLDHADEAGRHHRMTAQRSARRIDVLVTDRDPVPREE